MDSNTIFALYLENLNIFSMVFGINAAGFNAAGFNTRSQLSRKPLSSIKRLGSLSEFYLIEK